MPDRATPVRIQKRKKRIRKSVEITRAMIDAGISELEHALGSYDDAGVVRLVYTAMRELES